LIVSRGGVRWAVPTGAAGGRVAQDPIASLEAIEDFAATGFLATEPDNLFSHLFAFDLPDFVDPGKTQQASLGDDDGGGVGVEHDIGFGEQPCPQAMIGVFDGGFEGQAAIERVEGRADAGDLGRSLLSAEG
jgi:hypothetical protein